MTSNEEAHDDLVSKLEDEEAGVAELLDLYDRLEDVYVTSSVALSDTPYATTSNSTNRE